MQRFGRRVIGGAVVVALALGACGGDDDDDDDDAGDTTTASTPAPTDPPSGGPPGTDAPGSTAPPATDAGADTTSPPDDSAPPDLTGATVAVVDGALLGWTAEGDWETPDPTGVAVPPLAGVPLRPVAGGEPFVPAADPTAGCFPEAERATWYLDGAPDGLLVSGDHPLGRVEEIGKATEHEQAVAGALADLGIPGTPVEVVRVLRFDAEGDGVFEVLVEANKVADDGLIDLAEDDYSVIVLRRVVGGVARDVIVEAEVNGVRREGETPHFTLHEVAGVADVDGDGTLEVALRWRGYEWGGADLVGAVDLGGSDHPTLLTAGCGV